MRRACRRFDGVTVDLGVSITAGEMAYIRKAGAGLPHSKKCATSRCQPTAYEDRATTGGRLFGFVLVEPAGYVEHFGDVMAGAAADAMRFFRNAHEHCVDIQ